MEACVLHVPSLHVPSLYVPSLHVPSLHVPSLHVPSLHVPRLHQGPFLNSVPSPRPAPPPCLIWTHPILSVSSPGPISPLCLDSSLLPDPLPGPTSLA
ncbi:hypothetical protein FHG87_015847 [Trinorchestia longiramus]|nr:hypothetical protein FHG87_015847 [Trinorchestia longiramus]